MSRLYWRSRLILALLVASILVSGSGLSAQQASTADASKDATPSAQDQGQDASQRDPLKRPIDEKKKKENAKSLKQELSKTYKKWLDEDVIYIISDAERKAFKQLSNDEERDQFIEAFWQRRNPDPDSEDNEFKDEHYRRIEYANANFASGIPGWKTDRGRIYIKFGKPDEIDAHPSGGVYNRTMEEGGGETSTFPFETWRYRHLDNIGEEVEIEFVDTCMCNDYHMTIDKNEKDALLHTPGAGLTMYEELGMANKADRITGTGNVNGLNGQNNSKEFDTLEQYAKLNAAPQVKFKDLEEVVTSRIRYNLMPFDVRADFVKVTSETVLVPLTIQVKNRDVTFVNKDGVQRGTVNIFGRVTTLSGRSAQTFEDTVQIDVPAELLAKTAENSSVYWKALPLRPGRYRFDIVVKDVNGDRMGTWSRGLIVPDMSDDKGLTSSTLILADVMEKVPSKSIGTGMFVIGSTKVRPRMDGADGSPAKFNRNQRLNFWMQVYNLGINDQSKKSSAQVEYDIVNAATKKSVVHTVETTDQLGNVGDQITLEKSMSLASLEPGTYELTVKVNDNISKQSIAPTAKFLVQ